MYVKNATVIAKKRYCEIRKPGWLEIIYKIEAKEALTDIEYQNYQQLEREMLNIVNGKAELISGLTKNNRSSARYSYVGCIFVVKYAGSVGKIVTVQRER